MNPYKVLGVKKNASIKTIRKAYLVLVKKHHPDTGGDEEIFKEIALAFEILSDPKRRKRYDETGKTDGPSKAKIEARIDAIVDLVVRGKTASGEAPNSAWVNIKARVLNSIETQQDEIKKGLREDQLLLARAEDLARRFKAQQEDDPVGRSLSRRCEEFKSQILVKERELELLAEVYEVFKTYEYVVDSPEPEGQYSPELSTSRSRRISAILTAR